MQDRKQKGSFIVLLSGAILFLVFSFFFEKPVVTSVLSAALRQSVPLFLGALCGLIGERAGVMNIGIEGQMLFSAFIGFVVCAVTGNLYVGAVSGLLAGALMGSLLAFMAVTLRMDQIVAGMVLNIFAGGLTGYFYQTGMTIPNKFKAIDISGLSSIPLLGPVLFQNPLLTYISILLVFFIHYLLFNTRWGLRTRAVGEHPLAADTLGVSVSSVRYSRLIFGGSLAGLAGVFLSLEAVGTFERGMISGKGFIALAVMIFGRWTPLGSFGAALLFGLLMAIQTQLQFDQYINIPHQFIGMIPYALTVIVLSVFAGRVKPPKALGTPYHKEIRS